MSLVLYCSRVEEQYDRIKLPESHYEFYLEDGSLYVTKASFICPFGSKKIISNLSSFSIYKDVLTTNIFLIVIHEMEYDNILQIFQFPQMELLFKTKVSRFLRLSSDLVVQDKAFANASEFDFFIDDIVKNLDETVYLKKIAQFDPYDKLKALIEKDQIEEARSFALSKNLDQTLIYQAELRKVLLNFRETEEEYSILVSLLKNIEIREESVFECILLLRNYPSPEIQRALMTSLKLSPLCDNEQMDKIRSLNSRFECFMKIYSFYDQTQWIEFNEKSSEEIFESFMLCGEFEKALHVWSYFKGQIVDIIDSRMTAIEKAFQGTSQWPCNALNWTSEILQYFKANLGPNFFTSYTDKAAQIKASFTGLQSETGFDANPLDKLVGIIDWIKIIKLLSEEYAIEIEYSSFSEFKAEKIARQMVLHICHLKGCHLAIIGDKSLNEFLKNNHINFKNFIFSLCKELIQEISQLDKNLVDNNVKTLTILINVFEVKSAYRHNLLKSLLPLINIPWPLGVHELFLNTMNSILDDSKAIKAHEPMPIEQLFSDKTKLSPSIHLNYRQLISRLDANELKAWQPSLVLARKSAIQSLLYAYNISTPSPLILIKEISKQALKQYINYFDIDRYIHFTMLDLSMTHEELTIKYVTNLTTCLIPMGGNEENVDHSTGDLIVETVMKNLELITTWMLNQGPVPDYQVKNKTKLRILQEFSQSFIGSIASLNSFTGDFNFYNESLISHIVGLFEEKVENHSSCLSNSTLENNNHNPENNNSEASSDTYFMMYNYNVFRKSLPSGLAPTSSMGVFDSLLYNKSYRIVYLAKCIEDCVGHFEGDTNFTQYPREYRESFFHVHLKSFAETLFRNITDNMEIEFFIILKRFEYTLKYHDANSRDKNFVLVNQGIWHDFLPFITRLLKFKRLEENKLNFSSFLFDNFPLYEDSLRIISFGMKILITLTMDPTVFVGTGSRQLVHVIFLFVQCLLFACEKFSHIPPEHRFNSETMRLLMLLTAHVTRLATYFTPQEAFFKEVVPQTAFLLSSPDNKRPIEVERINMYRSIFKYTDSLAKLIIHSLNDQYFDDINPIIESLSEVISDDNLEFNDSLRQDLVECLITDFFLYLSLRPKLSLVEVRDDLNKLVNYCDKLSKVAIDFTMELCSLARNRKFRVSFSGDYLRYLGILVQRFMEMPLPEARKTLIMFSKKFEGCQAKMKILGHVLMSLKLYIPQDNPEMEFLENSAHKIVKTLYWQDRFKLMEISFNLSHDANYVIKAIGRLIRMVPCPLQPNFSICLSRDGIIRYESCTVLVPHIELSFFLRLKESFPQISDNLEKALLVRLSHLLESRLDQQLAASGMNLDSALDGNSNDFTLVDVEKEMHESISEAKTNNSDLSHFLSNKMSALLAKQKYHFTNYIRTVLRQSVDIFYHIKPTPIFNKIKETMLSILPHIHPCDYELRLFVAEILNDTFADQQPIKLIKCLKDYKRTRPSPPKFNGKTYIHPLQNERINYVDFKQNPADFIKKEVTLDNLDFWLETNSYLNVPLNEDTIILGCASNLLRGLPTTMEIFSFDEAAKIESEEYVSKIIDPLFVLINRLTDKKLAVIFLEEEIYSRSLDPYIQLQFLCKLEKNLLSWQSMQNKNFDLSLNFSSGDLLCQTRANVDAIPEEKEPEPEIEKEIPIEAPPSSHHSVQDISMDLDVQESAEPRTESDCEKSLDLSTSIHEAPTHPKLPGVVDLAIVNNDEDIFDDDPFPVKLENSSRKKPRNSLKNNVASMTRTLTPTAGSQMPDEKTATGVRFQLPKKNFSTSLDEGSFTSSFSESKISETRDRLKISIILILMRQLDLISLWPHTSGQTSFKKAEDLLTHCLVEVSLSLSQSSAKREEFHSVTQKNITNVYRFKVMENFFELMRRIHEVPRMFSLTSWIASELVQRLRLANSKAEAIRIIALIKPICRFWSSSSSNESFLEQSLIDAKNNNSDDLYNEYDFDTEIIGDQLSESILNYTHMPDSGNAESNSVYRQRLSVAVLDNTNDGHDALNISLNNTVANFMKKFQSKSSIKVSKIDQGMDQHGPCKVDQISIQILLRLVTQRRRDEWINLISSRHQTLEDKENAGYSSEIITEENKLRIGLFLARTWGFKCLEHETLFKSLLPYDENKDESTKF